MLNVDMWQMPGIKKAGSHNKLPAFVAQALIIGGYWTS